MGWEREHIGLSPQENCLSWSQLVILQVTIKIPAEVGSPPQSTNEEKVGLKGGFDLGRKVRGMELIDSVGWLVLV